jgi:hypothetical protein
MAFIPGYRDSLVLAQWDEDGTHQDPETGEWVIHRAGDFKFNEDGDLCYETLGDRDASTKNFLSNFDTITVDGSFWNQFDFLDSDDRDKSVMGSIAKSAFMAAPVILGSMMGPVGAAVASAYGLSTAALEFVKNIPNVYKALEGLVNSEETFDYNKKSGVWRAMNKLQAWGKSNNTSVSEHS